MVVEHQTAEQILAKNIEVLGEDAGRFYTDLSNECTWLHTIWLELDTLFGESEKRVDLLNRTAGSFFYLVQDIFSDHVLLQLARLTDPVESRGRRNLTLRALPGMAKDPDAAARVGVRVAELLEAADFARQHRNARVAHTDVETLRDSRPVPLAPATVGAIRKALRAASVALNEFEISAFGSHVYYDIGAAPLGGADALLRHLRAGVYFLDDWRERLLRGEADARDRELWSELG